ncbi:MAG: cation:proton antiporter [Parachlamydiales bacterium]|jgi:CPA2 family monovalent cation:H+ antiporter-2
MEHSLAIVAILTIGFSLASFLGYITQRLNLPTILGYLLAGFVIGPYSPGYVADLTISEQLAEIGVILMLFGVGMHFKLEDLINVKNIAIPGATVQTLAATIIGTTIVYAAGWPLVAGLIIGLSIGVASTVVLVRVLSDRNLLNTQQGHIAVGWLVVEDIFTVIILILLPTISALSEGASFSYTSLIGSVLFVMGKFVVLALLMFTWGHKVVGFILTNIARVRSQELFTLTVLAIVFVIAAGSAVVFGTSIALGAFIAGMVIGKTSVRHQAAANALPFKDIFAIIFFLSVGMLFNPMAIVTHFGLFIGLISVILIVKPLAAYLITIFLKYPLKVALTVAISLAQIGEFSFILAEEAMNLKLLPDDGFDILVACALISISINPLLFQMLDYTETYLLRMKFFREFNLSSAKAQEMKKLYVPKVVVVGFGPIGREVSKILRKIGYIPMIIEHNIDTVSALDEDNALIFGDAAEENILKDANLADARYLIITIPDTAKTCEIIHAARQVNPTIQIIARVQYHGERYLMEQQKVPYICTEDEALAAFTHLVRRTVLNSKVL